MSACIIVWVHMCTFMVCLSVHALLVCVYIQFIYSTLVSMYIDVCVCMSVYTWALFKPRECLIPVCVGVFLFRLMQTGEVSASTAAG